MASHGSWQIRPSDKNLKRRLSIVASKTQRFALHPGFAYKKTPDIKVQGE